MSTERSIKCPRCTGEGVVPDDGEYTEGLLDMECPACYGLGWLQIEDEEDD